MFGLLLLLSATAYGFAAANDVPEAGAGDGQGAISGYDVTAVTYTLNATTPSNLATVAFDVDPTASSTAAVPATVKVKLVSASSIWFGCTNTSGSAWTCTITGVTAAETDELRVVAAQ